MTRFGRMPGFARALCMSMVIGGITLLCAPSIAHAAPEGVALIETTVPLEDTSEAGITDAVNRAVNSAVRGAMAMGLSWVQLQRAYISGNFVGVQVLAATESLDTPSDDGATAAPGEEKRVGETLTRL